MIKIHLYIILTCFHNITWQVRAAATYALGTLVTVGSPPNNAGSDDDIDEATEVAEQTIARCLLKVLSDGSPLVRAELAIGANLFFNFIIDDRDKHVLLQELS